MDLDEELIETWKQSVLEIQVRCNWVTLWDGEKYYPEALPREVDGWDLYMITAYNPGSIPVADSVNRDRDKELFKRASALGSAPIFVSVGRSLSGSHTEYGYGICSSSKEEMDQLAREFGQIGYYKFTKDEMQIFAVDEAGEFARI